MFNRIIQKVNSSALAEDEKVVYWYKRRVLQEEVRKRTSYIGVHRTTKEGVNLLDNIAMTLDETDLFNSYYVDAAATVYDVLSGLMSPDTLAFEITKPFKTVKVGIPTAAFPMTYLSHQLQGINLIVSATTDTYDTSTLRLWGTVVVKYIVEYDVSGTGRSFQYSKEMTLPVTYTPAQGSQATTISFVPDLAPSTGNVSAERFIGIDSIVLNDCSAVLISFVKEPAGTLLENEGRYYISDGNAVASSSDLSKLQEAAGDISDAAVYRISNSDNFDTNAIPAIDISVFNLFVTYIMWKWFVDVNPDEASNCYQLFKDNKDKLTSRMNKSKLGTTEIQQRMW